MHMPKRYPPEFRRKILDLLESGGAVASIAHDLDVSGLTIYLWRRQDEIDRGLRPGSTDRQASLGSVAER
jgi:diaminopimelate decarboxylase